MDSARIREALEWIERETHFRTVHARMLSDGIQGEFLQAFSTAIRPSAVLEIGTFTGYSSVCLCTGLQDGGHLDACEINDELEDVIREGWRRAGTDSCSILHIGDAKETLKHLNGPYDIVYIDADKREYSEYYDTVFPKVREGGWILADNVLWSGKIGGADECHDAKSASISSFMRKVSSDTRVDAVTLPIRDGLCVIRIRSCLNFNEDATSRKHRF